MDKLKPVRHLLQLAEKYSKERLEKACQRASNCKLFSYASVKNILENNLDSQPLETPQTQAKSFPYHVIDLQEILQITKVHYTVKETFEEKLEKATSIFKTWQCHDGGF